MQQPLTSVPLADAKTAAPQLPPRPRSIDDTGLSMTFVSDMIIRALYLIGEMTGQQIVDLLHLPYDNVIDQGIAYLRREQMCEIKGTGGVGGKNYRYQATSKGVERAKEIGERTQYLGPAPVPLEAYSAMMKHQTTQGLI